MDKEYMPVYFNNNFVINHARYINSQGMPTDHYHDFYEIYIYLGNEMVYFINDRPYRVSKNQIIFINKNIYHKTRYYGDKKERIIILFDDVFLNIFSDENMKIQVKELFNSPVSDFPKKACSEICDILLLKIGPLCQAENLSERNLLRAKFLLAELLLSFIEFKKEELFKDTAVQLSTAEKRVSEIVSYINRNYSNEITLEFLSKYFFINRYYLCHIFKQVTGISTVDFINCKRIAEAEKLLKLTTHTVTDISCMVGFNNTNYFIGLFKKKNGITPKNFRRF